MAITGRIQAVVTPGIYLVRDASGRLHRAASADLWKKMERVAVIDGVIIGKAGAEKSSTVYEA